MIRRYIGNAWTKVVHRKKGLTEPCNTDDIAKRNLRFFEKVPAGYRRCQRCAGYVS